MKSSTVISFLLLMSFNAMAANPPEKVTLYVDDSYPPYSFHKNGIVQGLYIDILRAAFEQMPAFDVTLQAVPWNRGKKLMKTGEGMGLAPAYFHGHDWPYLYPYSLPLYRETVAVICNASVQQKSGRRWPQDFKGLFIGSIKGYDGWGGPDFRDMVDAGEINYIEVSHEELLIKMVATGRNDCFLMEAFTYEVVLSELIQSGELKLKEKEQLVNTATAGVDWVFVGYSAKAISENRYPFQAQFQKQLDIALYDLYKSGKMQAITSNYRK